MSLIKIQNISIMEKSVEVFVLINFFVIGASHLLQPREWVSFFSIVRSKGKAGVMANGFLSLIFGSIIVAFHWVWEGIIPISITCIGVGQVVKSMIAFIAPELSLKMLYRPMAENLVGYRIIGALFLVFSGILLYHLSAV